MLACFLLFSFAIDWLGSNYWGASWLLAAHGSVIAMERRVYGFEFLGGEFLVIGREFPFEGQLCSNESKLFIQFLKIGQCHEDCCKILNENQLLQHIERSFATYKPGNIRMHVYRRKRRRRGCLLVLIYELAARRIGRQLYRTSLKSPHAHQHGVCVLVSVYTYANVDKSADCMRCLRCANRGMIL